MSLLHVNERRNSSIDAGDDTSKPNTRISPSRGKFYLHMATYYLSADSAKHQTDSARQWGKFQRQNPEVLGDLDLHLFEINVQGKNFNMMTAGPLGDRNEADDRCRKLAEVKISCRVISR